LGRKAPRCHPISPLSGLIARGTGRTPAARKAEPAESAAGSQHHRFSEDGILLGYFSSQPYLLCEIIPIIAEDISECKRKIALFFEKYGAGLLDRIAEECYNIMTCFGEALIHSAAVRRRLSRHLRRSYFLIYL
jgi:hypothetical protein